jgi:nitrogen fixation protein FixH
MFTDGVNTGLQMSGIVVNVKYNASSSFNEMKQYYKGLDQVALKYEPLTVIHFSEHIQQI